MTTIFLRIFKIKVDMKMGWNEIAKRACVPVATWMTGLPTNIPTDDEIRAIAPVLNTTYEYLKYGIEQAD